MKKLLLPHQDHFRIFSGVLALKSCSKYRYKIQACRQGEFIGFTRSPHPLWVKKICSSVQQTNFNYKCSLISSFRNQNTRLLIWSLYTYWSNVFHPWFNLEDTGQPDWKIQYMSLSHMVLFYVMIWQTFCVVSQSWLFMLTPPPLWCIIRLGPLWHYGVGLLLPPPPCKSRGEQIPRANDWEAYMYSKSL